METGKHGLRQELRLRDLVLMQVTLIVGSTWVGFAAKQGSTQGVLWLLAIGLFYLPLAAVVMALSRAMPVEGGVYQWVKAGISPFAGYMAGWSLTVYFISAFGTVGSTFATSIAYGLGPRGSWVAESRWLAFALTFFAALLAVTFNVRGMQVAKWLSNAGSVLTVASFVLLFFLLARAWASDLPFARGSLALPGFSIFTLNVLSKMSVGALSGFDNSAVFCEECRKPGNDVALSVVIAAPAIALMYTLGTSAVLAYNPPAKVDFAAPVPQVLQAGFGSGALGRSLAAAGIGASCAGLLASMVICIGMVSRLPMVAGWDGLLPAWWSELHPRFRTPVKAIVAITAGIVTMSAIALWGTGNQEAVQVTGGAGIGALCIMYMLLFAVILAGRRGGWTRSGWGVRLGALAAFSVALLSLVFQIVPLGEVASPALFAIKVGGALAATYAIGAYLYWRGSRRLTLLPSVPPSPAE